RVVERPAAQGGAVSVKADDVEVLLEQRGGKAESRGGVGDLVHPVVQRTVAGHAALERDVGERQPARLLEGDEATTFPVLDLGGLDGQLRAGGERSGNQAVDLDVESELLREALRGSDDRHGGSDQALGRVACMRWMTMNSAGFCVASPTFTW